MLAEGLVSFQVVVKETDLHVSAEKDLKAKTLKAVNNYRGDLKDFIAKNSHFAESYVPVVVSKSAPSIIKDMAAAARVAGVGPMAAVAGAMAEYVGKDLLALTNEVIVENGGDIFLKTAKPRKVVIFAGDSPLSNKIALEIRPEETPLGVCTSAGTVGHSVSFGEADAVVVISQNTCLADAAATAIGNRVHKVADIDAALSFAQSVDGLKGVVIIKDDKMGVWGNIQLAPVE